MTVQRSTLHLGGGDVSVSMLATWWRCPRLFYYTYLHPLDEAQGIEPMRTASPLLVGGAVHEALEAYYRSGWKDGNYDLGAALAKAQATFAKRRDEFIDDNQYEDDLAEVVQLLRAYHGLCGPEGTLTEYPKTKIIEKDGVPQIEQTFTVPLGTGGYRLTVRPDALIEHHGFTCSMEHKTTTASGVARLLARMAMDAQAIAQMAILQECLPERTWNGVLVNVLVKKHSPRSKLPPVQRQLVHYPGARVAGFLGEARTAIRQIEDACGSWNELVRTGVDPVGAASIAFPMVGLFTGACVQFSRCAMYPLCSAPGREYQTIPAYRPRTYHTQEDPDA